MPLGVAVAYQALEFSFDKNSIPIDAFSPTKGLETFADLISDNIFAEDEHPVALFHQLQRLANHFAGGIVAAGLHFCLNEMFEFGGEVDVHALNARISLYTDADNLPSSSRV